MRELTLQEVDVVSGGNTVGGFIIGYVASKVLDAAVDAYVDMVKDFAASEHNTTAPEPYTPGNSFGVL